MTDLVSILKSNQRDKTQPPHLSASSLSLHMRCPRQWQQSYVFGQKGESNDAQTIGKGVHLALSRRLMGAPEGNWWKEVTLDSGYTPEDATSQTVAETMLYFYWEQVGKHLSVVSTERELLIDVPGVDLPILGYVDIETPQRLIDLKTTRYFSRKGVRPNKEWRFQQGIYQLEIKKPAEIHVLTRAKSDPVVVPDSTEHALHFGMLDTEKIATMVSDEWNRIKFHWETYGENPWPGNSMHDWAGKYCSVVNCCAL